MFRFDPTGLALFFYLVAASGFRFVESLVRVFEDHQGILRAFAKLSQTNTARNVEYSIAVGRKNNSGDFLPQFLCQTSCPRGGSIRQRHAEFIAAVTCSDIG